MSDIEDAESIEGKETIEENPEEIPSEDTSEVDDFGDFNDNNNEDEDDDFDDFVEEAEEEEEIPDNQTPQQQQAIPEAINCLNESTFHNSAQLQASVLSILQPITQEKKNSEDDPDQDQYRTVPPPLEHITPKAYFSERSESLWNQLAVMAPEVHPIDWKRSSIRRLMLVSLGVPLDLDEILPNKNTKRLILPSSRAKESEKKTDTKSNTDTQEQDAKENQQQPEIAPRDAQSQNEIDELNVETELSLSKWQQLANVSVEACEGMEEEELNEHVEALKSAKEQAENLFTKWENKKQAAEKDKEAFEGVIESLLEYAQRLRRK